MKKLLLLTGFSLAVVAPAFSQGSMSFLWTGSSFSTGIKIGSPSNPSAQLSGWYVGSDYSAEAYMATGTGVAEGSLAPIAATLTSMGFVAGTATTAGGGPGTDGSGLINGAAPDTGLAVGNATIQVRVWYNGGQYATYEAALAAGVNTGKSLEYTIALAGSGTPPPSLDDIGMAAFNVQGTGTIMPEPSTFALAGLGAAALLIFRRRK